MQSMKMFVVSAALCAVGSFVLVHGLFVFTAIPFSDPQMPLILVIIGASGMTTIVSGIATGVLHSKIKYRGAPIPTDNLRGEALYHVVSCVDNPHRELVFMTTDNALSRLVDLASRDFRVVKKLFDEGRYSYTVPLPLVKRAVGNPLSDAWHIATILDGNLASRMKDRPLCITDKDIFVSPSGILYHLQPLSDFYERPVVEACHQESPEPIAPSAHAIVAS